MLVGRAWRAGAGPSLVVVRGGQIIDISAHAATMAELLERADAPETAHGAPGDAIGTLAGLLANAKNTEGTRLLAPSDLQAIKACGVTFAIGPTVHGAGEIACNTYSLPHTQALIDGLNRDQPGTRQLILPRSGFAGIQRNAVAVWSGW